jgi:hypothetical protein
MNDIAGVKSGIFILFKVLTDVTGPGSPLITNLTCPAEGSVYLEWTKPEVTSPLRIFHLVFFKTKVLPPPPPKPLLVTATPVGRWF